MSSPNQTEDKFPAHLNYYQDPILALADHYRREYPPLYDKREDYEGAARHLIRTLNSLGFDVVPSPNPPRIM